MNYITVSISGRYKKTSLVMPVLRELLACWTPERFIKDSFFDLLDSDFKPERAICLGKCALSFARGIRTNLPNLDILCYSTIPEEHSGLPKNVKFLWGSHPHQSRLNVMNSKIAVKWLKETRGDLLAFVSGGASALLAAPPEGWSIKEVISIESALLKTGASIEEINSVRMRLSSLRGGGAAELLFPHTARVFIWCDVSPKLYRITGSAPFGGVSASSKITAEKVLKKYGMAIPKALPEEKAARGISKRFRIGKLADDKTLLDDFEERLKKKGLPVKRIKMKEGTSAGGLANEISRVAKKTERPAIIPGGGEFPVKVEKNGRGGRCSHLSLLVAKELYDLKKVVLLLCRHRRRGRDGRGRSLHLR